MTPIPRLALLLAGLLSTSAAADSLRVAVAANFAGPLQALAADFQARTGHSLDASPGSTGKLYAQIRAGAPFALFLAADAATPEKLEREGQALAGTRRTYALGRLALWSPDPARVDPQGAVLGTGAFHHLALANPRLAPYGAAARAVLEHAGLWTALQAKLVLGENIAQAYQFVRTGAAELGFVALAQVWQDGRPHAGSLWLVPAELHPPLRQDAVLLKDEPAARAFLAYLGTPEARRLIAGYGYDLPEAAP